MTRCLVVLVAFLALQATCDAALPLSPEAWFQQLVDQAKALRAQIDTAVANVEDNIVNRTDEIVTRIHDDIQTVANRVRTDVESAVNKFVEAGKNVVECSVKIPSEVEDLISNISTSATNCVSTEIKDGESIVADLIQKGKEVNDTINSVSTKLAECNKNFLTAATCSFGVVSSAAGTISSDSVSIFTDITKASALVAGFPMNVNSCETAVFASVPAQEAALLSEVYNCYTGE